MGTDIQPLSEEDWENLVELRRDIQEAAIGCQLSCRQAFHPCGNLWFEYLATERRQEHIQDCGRYCPKLSESIVAFAQAWEVNPDGALAAVSLVVWRR